MNPRAILLITDSSIWIDLIKGRLLDAFFRLPYLKCTSTFIRDYESVGIDWQILEAKGLQFLGLSGEETARLYITIQSHRNLSVPDVASLFIAQRTNGVLLTSDNKLRLLANGLVEVHGFLWVMDQLVTEKVVIPIIAIETLQYLQKDARVRFPKIECDRYIKKWRGLINEKKE